MSSAGRKIIGSRLGAALTCVMALGLTQCKDEPLAPEVVTENLVAPVNTTTVKAVEAKTFTFAGGGAALGPTYAGQTFSVAFSNTAASTPTATFTIGGTTYTATTTFGSCIFNFSPSAPPGVSNPLTVNPCNIQLATAGATAGTTTNTNATMTFGGATSAPTPVTVTITSSGQVQVGGNTVGTVNTTPPTGG